MNSYSIVRTWDSDKQYVRDQLTDNSWSHETAWGETAATKFMEYGDALRRYDWMFHDDSVADFGGNDGFPSFYFYLRHGIKPLVIDCEPLHLNFAATEYGLNCLECFIEDIPLPDDSIDWGFCSHTLEHTRDPEKAVAEIARVVKRACYFVLPIEKKKDTLGNIAHSVCCQSAGAWKELLKSHWTIKGAGFGTCRKEVQLFAFPNGASK